MKKIAVIFIALFSAAVFAQDLPRIAVYVTGDVPDNEKKALGTRMLASLINSKRYKGIERSNSFLAEIEKEQIKQRSGEIDDNQISALGRQFGVKFVCIADITPVFGDFQVSSRIVDVETAEVVFIGEAFSPMKNTSDLAQVSDQVVKNMFNEEAKPKDEAVSQAKPEPAVTEPPPAVAGKAKTKKPKPEPKPKAEPREKAEFKISAGGGGFFANGIGGGVKWDVSKENLAMPYSVGGAYLFFDAVYAEAFAGFSAGGGKWKSGDANPPRENSLPDMSRACVNIGAFAKYPVAAWVVNVFPLLGVEYEASISGKLKDDAGEIKFDGTGGRPNAEALSAAWFKLGGGADFGLGKNLYLRAEFLYGWRTANAYEKDLAKETETASGKKAGPRPANGLTIKAGAGVKF